MGLILDPTYLQAQRELAINNMKETDGLLPNNYFWSTLRDRYELNPERFTHYHPLVGKWFEHEHEILCKPVIPICPDEPYVPCPPKPPVVPEPSTIIMMSMALIGIFIWRKL